MPPDWNRQPPPEARLLRAQDLIDLRLEAPGCTLEPTDGGAELVAGPKALLIVHFPPQHLGEELWQAGATPPPPIPSIPPVPNECSKHVSAGPSRLVFEVPEGARITYTLEGVLAVLPTLRLHVAANATPLGETSRQGGPVKPAEDETAIEAPYRLIVSPSQKGAFRHPATPLGTANSVELWRTHLTVRRETDDGTFDRHDDTNAEQRIVRALWTRDRVLDKPGFAQPLSSEDRKDIVKQTHGGDRDNAESPLQVSRLALSSLGAWFDWRQSWEFGNNVVDYRHQSFMGRDGYVRVAYSGILFPFGHRCFLVKITEREIKHRDKPVAYLWQRWFIVLRQPTRSYAPDERDNPFGQVTISPLVTPDIDKPPESRDPFVPRRNGDPYPFTLTTVDRGGQTHAWSAPLVFIHANKKENIQFLVKPEKAALSYFLVRQIQGRGQSLAVAKPVKAGDTSVEVSHLIFDGKIDSTKITCRPSLKELRAVVPSMRHLAPQAPAVDLVFAKRYITFGLPKRAVDAAPLPGKPNAGELILALKSQAPVIDFTKGTERSGGFVAPNLTVRGVSRVLGAIGENGDDPSPFDGGKFNPKTLFAGALPKLFGLFSLLELLLDEAGFSETPAFVSDALNPIDKLLREAQRLRAAVSDAQTRMAAEVAGAAHGGAKAVAQAAKDDLDAKAIALQLRLDALITAIAGLQDNPGLVSTAAASVATALQPLLDALGAPGFPAAVRASITKPLQILQQITKLASVPEELEKLKKVLSSGQVTARLSWRPKIKPWGLSTPKAPNIFNPISDSALHIDVEVCASATGPPSVNILAEIADFELNLIGNGKTALMQLKFRRIGFHSGSTGKPEVDVVFGGMAFLGPLAFVDRLRELIPFDGFSDPPYVDVRPDGVTAGFDIALPNVGIGVFSLENIALGADARVPFIGDAMTIGFHFCSKDAPFRLTVMCIGGGGWLGLRAAPKGLVLLELGLEACAALSIDLGVASGSVSIAVGVYLRLEAANGLLTAYFRIRGEVSVLGLIHASITLELALIYHFVTGKLIGRASLVVEIDILFFSASVEIVVERKLAGSKGDPTMLQLMPPEPDGTNADWAEYCTAFAPLPA